MTFQILFFEFRKELNKHIISVIYFRNEKKNWESKWGLETRKNKQPAEYCCIMFESELENWCLAFACEHYAIEIHSKTTGSTNIY